MGTAFAGEEFMLQSLLSSVTAIAPIALVPVAAIVVAMMWFAGRIVMRRGKPSKLSRDMDGMAK